MTQSEYMREWRKKNIEYVRAYDRARGERPRSPEAMARRKEKAKIRGRKWYRNNKARHNATGREWRKKNRQRARELSRLGYRRNHDKELERNKRYRASHLEQTRANARKWNREHPEQHKAHKRLSHARHRNEIAARRRAKYHSNPEKQKLASQKYRQENGPQCTASVRIWKKKNRESVRLFQNRRRTRKQHAKGRHSVRQWMARVEFYGWRCFYCQRELTEKNLRKDHRIPLSRGGTDFASNLVPACGSCNSRKHDKKPSEFSVVK